MDGQLHAPTAFPPGNKPGNHCLGGWVGPTAGLDGCGNLAPTGIRFPDCPGSSESLTDWAIPAHTHTHTHTQTHTISHSSWAEKQLTVASSTLVGFSLRIVGFGLFMKKQHRLQAVMGMVQETKFKTFTRAVNPGYSVSWAARTLRIG